MPVMPCHLRLAANSPSSPWAYAVVWKALAANSRRDPNSSAQIYIEMELEGDGSIIYTYYKGPHYIAAAYSIWH